MNYIDLFAGAGGLSEGFISIGFNPIAHVEMNYDACQTLKTRAVYHYLNKKGELSEYKKYLRGEISKEDLYILAPEAVLKSVIHQTMSVENMPALFELIDEVKKEQEINQIDLIVGGPPCQAYSLVGRAVKNDNMVGDPRNYLYKLYIEVLKKYTPTLFIFENVPGLLTANRGKYFEDMKKAFKNAGYTIDYATLNAKNFGVLQERRRIILIGWKKELGYKYPTFQEKTFPYKVADLLSDLPSIQAGEENNSYKTENINPYLKVFGIRKDDDVLTWHIARPHNERDRKIYKKAIDSWFKEKKRIKYTDLPQELCTHKNRTAFLDRYKVVASNMPTCHTMLAHISKDGHYFIHPDIEQARSITVREAARIQSFPDDFYFEGSRTAVFTQVGNAVPPLMAKGIAKEIKEILEK
jgi:DNA (cytosine-5)-methyltransferase 1